MEAIDLEEEMTLWKSTELSFEIKRMALVSLEETAKSARDEQKQLVDALRRELAYSLCWPRHIGKDTLVSKAYRLLGPNLFPIPDDPEPLHLALGVHEEKLSHMDDLLTELETLLSLMEDEERL